MLVKLQFELQPGQLAGASCAMRRCSLWSSSVCATAARSWGLQVLDWYDSAIERQRQPCEFIYARRPHEPAHQFEFFRPRRLRR